MVYHCDQEPFGDVVVTNVVAAKPVVLLDINVDLVVLSVTDSEIELLFDNDKHSVSLIFETFTAS